MAKKTQSGRFKSKLGAKADGLEFTRPADSLLGIIKETYKRNLGVDPTEAQVKAEAKAIIDSR